MNETNTWAVLLLGILGGALMAFGLVMVFEFLAGSGTCQASLYSEVSHFAANL